MAGRQLKAESDRALAANRLTAVGVHLMMDSQPRLQSAPPDRQKNPTGERGSSSRGKQRVENGYKQIHA